MEGKAAKGQLLESTLEKVSSDRLTPEIKRRLIKFFRDIDDLGRLDEQSKEVYVDERSLRKLLKEHLHLRPELEDRCVSILKTLPGSRLADISGSGKEARKMTPISWQMVASYVEAFKPSLDPALAALDNPSLSKSATQEEVRKVVQRQFPNIPDDLVDPETFTHRIQAAISSTAAGTSAAALPDPATVWDCLVRNFGWWVAFALLCIIGAALVALSLATGPGGAIAWTAFWSWFWVIAGTSIGLTTVGYVLICIFDPYRGL